MSEKRQQIKSFGCVAATFPDQDILAFLLLMSMMSIQYVCLLESNAVCTSQHTIRAVVLLQTNKRLKATGSMFNGW